MRWYQRLSTKLAAAVVLTVGLMILCIGFYITFLTYNRLRREAEDERQLKAAAIKQDLDSTNGLIKEQLKIAVNVFKSEAFTVGQPSLGPLMTVEDKNLPNLLLGKTPQANNFALVDKVKELTQSAATLYVKSGDSFIALVSSLQNADGKRIVGESLEANSKVALELKDGKPFYGIMHVADNRYLSAFEPVRSQSGEVIGAFAVSYSFSNLSQLGKRIEDTKILETGFFALVDDKGQIVYQSAKAPADQISKISQPDAKTGDGEAWHTERALFEPWNFNLVSAYSDGDPHLLGQLYSSQLRVIISDIVAMIFIAGLIALLMRRLMRPLEDVVKVANEVSQGKIERVIRVRSNDEVGQVSYSMNKMINYLQEMSSVADQISEGNLQVEISPRSADDRFGLAFQNMLEHTLRLVQTQDERNRLQRSIMKLLEEVADVGDGDLTTEAEVTADATGAIADAFNYMITELRSIIGRVKQTSARVDSSATKVQTSTEMMVRRSEQQSIQLNTLSTALEEMTNAMQQVAHETTASARVSDSALANAKTGTTVVNNNIAAMNRLRSRIQETSERIKRLGERSQEISSIVKIINDLAQRTSVLALNASIQATAAGPAGRGFVAVAEEVERLAERSAMASKQIDALTKAIQGETDDAVISMETTVKEVAVGVKLTGEVGETLNTIESVTQQLAKISQTIAVSARQQALTSADLSGAMRDVATTSQQNATGMKESATVVNQLAVWAQDLRGSVSSFRLPENDEMDDLVSIASPNTANATVGV